jgi:hypothetical protein
VCKRAITSHFHHSSGSKDFGNLWRVHSLRRKGAFPSAAININLPAALTGARGVVFFSCAQEKRWGRCFIIKSPRGDCISAGEVTQKGIPAAPFIIFHRYDAALFYCFINPSARWLYNNRIGAEEEKI